MSDETGDIAKYGDPRDRGFEDWAQDLRRALESWGVHDDGPWDAVCAVTERAVEQAGEQGRIIANLPDVAAYAGVGDGTVADAVTALIGSREHDRLTMREALSLLDEALGDTDVDGDDSPTFRARQLLAATTKEA